MFKQLTAAILILAFSASTFCRTVIVLDYYSHTAAYAKACVNKMKLSMHCNGKCQLIRKLEQQEKKDQDNLERKAANKNEIQPANTFLPVTCFSTVVTRHAIAHTVIGRPIGHSRSLLRPPIAA